MRDYINTRPPEGWAEPFDEEEIKTKEFKIFLHRYCNSCQTVKTCSECNAICAQLDDPELGLYYEHDSVIILRPTGVPNDSEDVLACTDYQPIHNSRQPLREIPATSPLVMSPRRVVTLNHLLSSLRNARARRENPPGSAWHKPLLEIIRAQQTP